MFTNSLEAVKSFQRYKDPVKSVLSSEHPSDYIASYFNGVSPPTTLKNQNRLPPIRKSLLEDNTAKLGEKISSIEGGYNFYKSLGSSKPTLEAGSAEAHVKIEQKQPNKFR